MKEDKMKKEELLEKYYNGETTLAEEQWLKKHVFNTEKTVEQLIFKDLEKLKMQNIPIVSVIKKRKNIYTQFVTISGLVAAACIVLFLWNSSQNPVITNKIFETEIGKELLVSNTIEGSIEDPEIALEQARKALAFVSEKLNTGTENINHLKKLNHVKK